MGLAEAGEELVDFQGDTNNQAQHNNPAAAAPINSSRVD